MHQDNFDKALKAEITFTKTLKVGAKGIGAQRVQEWVTFHGCRTPVDGDYGTATSKAVGCFQRANKLPETGTVNEETWLKLVKPMLDAQKDGSGNTLSARALSIAKKHLAIRPVEIGGPNRGPWVRMYTGGHDGPEWLWCAAFVSYVLRQASIELDRAMPIRGSVSCDSLAAQARENGIFVSETELTRGKRDWDSLAPGCIFLVRRTPTDWIHTGFAFGGDGPAFESIEGNSNMLGSANGFEVCSQTRAKKSKDFIALA